MKLKIALSGYAGSEDNLISLQNPVPNGDYTYFGMNPITHDPNARRINESIQPKAKEVEADAEPMPEKCDEAEMESAGDGDGLGDSSNPTGKNMLPDGADMYYGLKPLEHNPINEMVLGSNSPIKMRK